MRILYLAHRLPFPPDKGEKIRAFWQIQRLAARHQVDVFCFYDRAEDHRHVSCLERVCGSCYAEELPWLPSRLRALRDLVTGRPFTTGFFFSPVMAQRVRRAVDSGRYDLLFVYSSAMAQYARGVTGVPRVLDIVDVDSDKWAQYAHRAAGPAAWLWRREAKWLGAYEALLVAEFNRTLVCTEAEAAVLRRLIDSPKIGVLENPIDVATFDPAAVEVPSSLRALQPYVVFSGTMDYRPNVDAVLHFYRDVFPRLRKSVPAVRLVIAGRDPAPAVARLAADPAVHITGRVPDIRPYLRGAAAAVAPMRIARGVQNKILEAMAMGLPVAVSSRAAVALPQSLSSLLFVEDDPEAMAMGLARWIERGPAPPLAQIREAMVHYRQGQRLEEKFEGIVEGAVQESSRESPSARELSAIVR